MKILDERPKVAFEYFIEELKDFDVDIAEIRKQAQGIDPSILKFWYDKLDYIVYDTEAYLAELWICWVSYSRKYLKDIQKENSLFDKSIYSDIGSVENIVDLGCGIGYTTAALSELYPDANIIGTNISDTLQTAFAKKLGKKYNFTITDKIKLPVELVFASEYFEHIRDPIAHLQEILKFKPRVLLIANSFNTKAIGHFPTYRVGGFEIRPDQISRLFNTELRQQGYEKIKTKLWNNRPAYWKLID